MLSINLTIALVQIAFTIGLWVIIITLLLSLIRHVYRPKYRRLIGVCCVLAPVVAAALVFAPTENAALNSIKQSMSSEVEEQTFDVVASEKVVGYEPTVEDDQVVDKPISETCFFYASSSPSVKILSATINKPIEEDYISSKQKKAGQYECRINLTDNVQVVSIDPTKETPRIVKTTKRYYYRNPISSDITYATASNLPKILYCPDKVTYVCYIPKDDFPEGVTHA